MVFYVEEQSMYYHGLMGYLYDIFIFGLRFSGSRNRSTHCASTPVSYIMHNMATHVQAKAFAGTRGGTMFHKTFPKTYIFHCKNNCSNPKIIS